MHEWRDNRSEEDNVVVYIFFFLSREFEEGKNYERERIHVIHLVHQILDRCVKKQKSLFIFILLFIIMQMLEIKRNEGEEAIAVDNMTIIQPRKRRVSDVIDSIGDIDDFSSSELQSPVTSNDDLLENDVFEVKKKKYKK